MHYSRVFQLVMITAVLIQEYRITQQPEQRLHQKPTRFLTSSKFDEVFYFLLAYLILRYYICEIKNNNKKYMKDTQNAVLESLSVVEKQQLQKLANECKNFTNSEDISTKLFPVNPSEYNDTCIFLLVIKDILNVNKRDGKTQMAFTGNHLQTVRKLIYNS